MEAPPGGSLTGGFPQRPWRVGTSKANGIGRREALLCVRLELTARSLKTKWQKRLNI